MDAVTRRQLGVCYFPEHWDPADWPADAAEMRALGIDFVRIGEFSWGVTEPEPGITKLDWMQDSLDLLHSHDIKVVLCTPTATPPKWLVDSMPDMLATDRNGQLRSFGSRRHYSFAHMGYRREAARITRLVADRFGTHPAVIGWQTDNEYGCHNTTLSYGPVDLAGFRDWLAQRYQSVDALNRTWGNVFWSMQYGNFDEVELPNLTVTEANPAHWLDFYRFTSQMVAEFNQLQVDILRELSPGRDIIHNFMGRILDFDHYDVGRSWMCPHGIPTRSAFLTRCATCFQRITGCNLPAVAIRIFRLFIMTCTAPHRTAAGGSWNSSPDPSTGRRTISPRATG